MSDGTQGERTGSTRQDELGDLAREFDGLYDRLDTERAREETATVERDQAVRQLRHADRLSTVGKLAAGIAHEIGTPLNVVAERARMIQKGEVSGAEAIDSARIVVEQTGRIARITRQILDFAKVRVPTRVDVDLALLAKETLSLLAAMARKRNVDLALEADHGLTPARADPSQVQQVLMNLVVNSLQAMPKGGRVTVRIGREMARRSEDPAAPGIQCATIEVADDGEGIAPENLDRIFDPFFTTKEIGSGSGLGLSVAHGIVEEHGGWFRVESRPGEGTRFRIYLPSDP